MLVHGETCGRLGTIILHSLNSASFTCWHAVKQQKKLHIMDWNNGISGIVQSYLTRQDASAPLLQFSV